MHKYAHSRYFRKLPDELSRCCSSGIADFIISHLYLLYRFNIMPSTKAAMEASMRDFRNLAEAFRLPEKEIENIEIIFEDVRSQIDINSNFQIIGENEYRLEKKEG